MSADVIAAKASADYTLWLRYSDGLEGSVFLGNLLEIGAFRAWREIGRFLAVEADPAAGVVSWPSAGVRLDAEVLRLGLEHHGQPPASRPHDAAFQRFMARCLEPSAPKQVRRRGKR